MSDDLKTKIEELAAFVGAAAATVKVTSDIVEFVKHIMSLAVQGRPSAVAAALIASEGPDMGGIRIVSKASVGDLINMSYGLLTKALEAVEKENCDCPSCRVTAERIKASAVELLALGDEGAIPKLRLN